MTQFRHALAAITMLASASAEPGALAQGSSEISACRDIQDSLLRLRCFDDVSKPGQAKAATPPIIQPTAAAPEFSKHPAEKYHGPVRYPDFRGAERQHASFRTRLLAGAKAGPNYAGSLALVEIGCGGGCRFAPIVDLKTGHIIDFPLSGEDYPSLDLKYTTGSRLISARWISDERCKREDLVWTGSSFTRGKVFDLGDRDACYN